jgi:hypothetical protein
MIDLTFFQWSELIIVKIEGKKVRFGTTTYGAKLATIDGLKLDFNGTIREFPDLKDDLDWNKKAIERFKNHINKLNSEDKIANYIIEELKTKGYRPHLKQKAGFRPIKL